MGVVADFCWAPPCACWLQGVTKASGSPRVRPLVFCGSPVIAVSQVPAEELGPQLCFQLALGHTPGASGRRQSGEAVSPGTCS